MNTQFANIIAQGTLIIYFGDILIATEDDLEVHRRVVSQVLDQLQKLNLYLENGTVMMDPIKVSGVREWKVPTVTGLGY